MVSRQCQGSLLVMELAEVAGFAVDVGGTKTLVAQLEGGKVTREIRFPTGGNTSMDTLLEKVSESLTELGYERGSPLGFAVTGRVTSDGLWFAVNAKTLTKIDGVPLAAALSDRFGQITPINDVTAAAIAETAFGQGQGCRAFAYITVSTGVGGCLVIDNRPITSDTGISGHFGFASSRFSKVRCGSGRFGTVESVAAGRAMAAEAARMGHEGLEARHIFEEALTGADWAIEIIDLSAQAISALCSDLVAIAGVECIAFGGSIASAGGYLDRVRRFSHEEPELFQVPIVAARFPNNGVLLGALYHELGQMT
jgi:N-acylmannosamine kinase